MQMFEDNLSVFPVLRLDNSEPLDLNFGRSAYYNPGLQGDNIQMSHIPGRRWNWTPNSKFTISHKRKSASYANWQLIDG